MSHSVLDRELIISHYRDPQHAKLIDEYTHEGENINRSCGDEVKVRLSITNKGKIEDLGFEARGCALSIASCSIISEYLIGKDKQDLIDMKQSDLENMIGSEFSINRLKCVMLGLEAYKSALAVSTRD